jgi:hypothetical protein
VLLVAPTIIACAAAAPIDAGEAYKTAHATSPNNVFRKRDSPLQSKSAIYEYQNRLRRFDHNFGRKFPASCPPKNV